MKSKIFTSKNFLISLLLTLFLTTEAFSQCPSGLDAYLRFETTTSGNYPDEVSDHTGVVASGSPISVSGLVSVGKALSFNGTSDELNIINSADFNWSGADNFSIELWVKFTELNGTVRVFIGRDASSGPMQWWIGATDAGKVAWYIGDSFGNTAYLESTGAIDNGIWHHIVAVKNGTSLKLYIDGVATSATQSFTGNFNASSSSIAIGNLLADGTDYYFEGAIDEVALYNTALATTLINEHLLNNGSYGIGYCHNASPQIISTPNVAATIGRQYSYDVNASGNPAPTYALSTSPTGMTINEITGEISWTPTEASGNTNVVVEATNSQGSITQTFSIYLAEQPEYPSSLDALWKFDNSSFEYEFINQHQLVGSASQTTGLIDGAAYFDGSSSNKFELVDSYEEIPSSIFFDFPSLNYSVSFWINSSVTGNGTKVAVGRDVPSNNTSWWIGFDSDNGEAAWYATDYDDTNVDEVYISGGVVNDGSWHLITAVRDDNSNMDYLYVDGIMVNSASSNHADFGGDAPLTVGWFDINPYYYFEGGMDELAFFSKALSQAEIINIYNDGIAGNSIAKENYYPLFTTVVDNIAKEDVFYRDTVYFNDINEDDVLTASISGNPEWLDFSFTASDTFLILSGTPTNDEVEDYPITLMVNDGSVTTSYDFTLTVENENDLPEFVSTPVTIVDEDVLYEYTVKVSDIDADDMLTLTATQKPEWLTFTQQTDTTGLLSGTPLNDDAGTSYTITLNVNDGTVDVPQEFNIEVTALNDKPVINGQDPVSFDEDNEFTITMDLLDVTDVDNAAQDLSIEVLAGTNYTFENTVITPAENYFGGLTVNLVVSDGDSISDVFEFDMTVLGVNDAPEVISDIDSVAKENEEYSNVFEFFDAEGEEITVTVLEKPTWTTYANNTLSGTPTVVDLGEHNVHIRLQDASGAVVNIQFTLTVDNTNDKPVFESTPVTAADDYEPYEYIIDVSDADGEDVTIQVTVKPDWLTFDAAENKLYGTPEWDDANKSADVTIRASDAASSTEQTFQIVVTNQNDEPVITSEPIDSAVVGTNYSYLFKATDVDEDDDLTYTAEIIPDWMSFDETSAGGYLTGTPTADNIGNYTVILKVSDGRDETTEEFTLRVVTNTGIDLNLVKTLSVYPNPAQAEISIDLASLKNPDKIEILDVTGKVKITEYLVNYSNNLKLDVSSLVKGLYFVRIQDEEMTYLSKLIINK